jgi:hypothetical protein
MSVPTNDSQDFFEIQMQVNNKKKINLISKSKTILANLSPNINPLHKTTRILLVL